MATLSGLSDREQKEAIIPHDSGYRNHACKCNLHNNLSHKSTDLIVRSTKPFAICQPSKTDYTDTYITLGHMPVTNEVGQLSMYIML